MCLDTDLMIEDMQILQPDGSRACYNWETPEWTVIDFNSCRNKHDYSLDHPAHVYCDCCDGFDQECEQYK